MIDVDVHNSFDSAEDLLPYLDPNFKDYLIRGERPGPRGAFPNANRPWLHPEGFMRTDLTDDHNPGANWEVMKERLLDKYDMDFAILTGEEALEVSTMANPHYASALASAYNDYQVEEWLSRDPRLKGSLIVAPQSPQLAAKETGVIAIIRDCGHHSYVIRQANDPKRRAAPG